MKLKINKIALALLLLSVLFVSPALAQKSGQETAGQETPPASNVDPEQYSLTEAVLNSFDPLRVGGSRRAEELSTPGGVISRVLEFAFPLAGMILFVMIVVGGLQILTGAAGQKSLEEGRKKVTTAIVGFLLLFASYWVAQILERIFSIKIL